MRNNLNAIIAIICDGKILLATNQYVVHSLWLIGIIISMDISHSAPRVFPVIISTAFSILLTFHHKCNHKSFRKTSKIYFSKFKD